MGHLPRYPASLLTLVCCCVSLLCFQLSTVYPEFQIHYFLPVYLTSTLWGAQVFHPTLSTPDPVLSTVLSSPVHPSPLILSDFHHPP